jgi:valyl-tRNA synthetase
LLGAIDLEKEKNRREKEILNLKKIITGIKIKLSNKEFIKRAPKKIVEVEKRKLNKWQTELAKLQKNS